MVKAQILVVEDEIVVAESIRNSLESLDYGVPAIAVSGEEAIQKAGEIHPHLVLMDIKLAGDMDGIEAAEQIRTCFDIPVVYLTAFADDETLQRAKITEPYGYILKPLQVRDLRTSIEVALYKHEMESKLRASEERYRQSVENSPNPIFSIGKDGVIQTWNQACEQLFQYKPEEIIGQTFHRLLWDSQDYSTIDAMLAQVWQGESLSNEDMRYRSKDGIQHFTVSRLYPLYDSEQTVQRCVFANTDVTRRRRAEAEARQQTAQLEALREVGLKLTAELELDTLLHAIVSSAVELLGGTWGGLYLYRQDQDMLEWAATAGDSPLPSAPPLRRSEGLAGKVWDTGEPLIVDDYQQWDGRAASYEGYPLHAVVAAPVRWGEEILGVLDVMADFPRTFSSADAELLSLFATQATIAIRNARLFDKAHRQAERLAAVNRISRAAGKTFQMDSLVETVSREVTALFQADVFCIAFYDKETNELDYRIQVDEGVQLPTEQRPLDTGLTFRVIVEKKPLLIQNLEQERDHLPPLHIGESMNISSSWLGVPLQTDEQVIGVICVQAYRPHAFDEQDQLLLSTIADQVAMAMESARLFHAEREQRELAEALEEAATAISSALDLDKVLDRVLEQVERVVAGDAFNITLIEEGAVRAVRWRAQEHLNMEHWNPYPLIPAVTKYSNLAQMMQTGKSLIISDTTTDPDWVQQEGWEWVRSYVGTPIKLADSTIGFLAVDGTRPNQFSPADARRLETFSSHVATAIENARLYEQARRRMESLGNLNLASQVLASFLDVKEVLEQIVNLAGSVANSDYTSVVLLNEAGELARQADDFRDVPPISQRIRAKGVTRHVLESGQPLVVDIISDEGKMNPPVHQSDGTLMQANPDIVAAGIHSFAAIPIQAKGITMGVMFVHSREPQAFHRQLSLLTTFANQAAVAIENARLFQAEQEQRELAEALAEAAAIVNTLDLDQILDHILEQVERIVAGDAFNIMLLENDVVQAVRWRGYKHLELEERIAHLTVPLVEYPSMVRMAETGEPLVIPDTGTDPDWTPEKDQERWRSYVGAPIRIEGEAVGFLNVNGTRPRQFSSADARRLQAFADHTATAVANAQLHQQVLDYAEQLEQRVHERTELLMTQYASMQAILHSTAEGIIGTDENGKILQLNPVAHTWLTHSLSPEDAQRLRKTVQDLARRADERPGAVLELTGRDLELRTTPISTPNIEETLPMAQGEPTAVVAIHDISELKALDRMKTNFIKNASHELRTPITTIKLYVHLMQQSSPENDQWRTYLDSLAREIDNQTEIGEAILQLSRIYSGQMKMEQRPTPLHELTEVAILRNQSLARQKKLELEHRAAKPGPAAVVDARQMVQVLDNLVRDAIRYSPEGARVVITTEQKEMEEHIWATITVSNTGEYIQKRDMLHMFERLLREGDEEPESQRIRETGLRLIVVKEIVELHGGHVTVESEKDLGTTFTVWLPPADWEISAAVEQYKTQSGQIQSA